MAKSDRTIEDIRTDLAAEREHALEAFGRLGNDVDDILSDLRRKATSVGRRAALLASAAAAACGTYVVLRRRRRTRRANAAAEEE
jgi:hypothetical protein